jgi:hypothetical protein
MDSLANVKVGDVLAADGYGKDVRLMKVVAVGKLHVTTEGGTKWRIETGKRAGDSSGWNSNYARIATDGDRLKVRIKKAQDALSKFQVTDVNVDDVMAFLNEHRKES